MEVLVQRWGKEVGLRLPEEMLEVLKVGVGDTLTVHVQSDGVLLKVKRREYVLADLLAQCDSSAPQPADLDAWFNIRPAGREAS